MRTVADVWMKQMVPDVNVHQDSMDQNVNNQMIATLILASMAPPVLMEMENIPAHAHQGIMEPTAKSQMNVSLILVSMVTVLMGVMDLLAHAHQALSASPVNS